MKVFVDSDVIISSLLSSKGAANMLINTVIIDKIISNYSLAEIDTVIDRIKLDKEGFTLLRREKLKVVEIAQSIEELKEANGAYVLDQNDAHIIAGAKEVRAGFLITYNLKDYKLEKIKQDLDLIVLTPGQFLQYFRSLR